MPDKISRHLRFSCSALTSVFYAEIDMEIRRHTDRRIDTV